MFRNWIGRSQEEIVQAREDWMTGTRFGQVKGYDGAPLPAPGRLLRKIVADLCARAGGLLHDDVALMIVQRARVPRTG